MKRCLRARRSIVDAESPGIGGRACEAIGRDAGDLALMCAARLYGLWRGQCKDISTRTLHQALRGIHQGPKNRKRERSALRITSNIVIGENGSVVLVELSRSEIEGITLNRVEEVSSDRVARQDGGDLMRSGVLSCERRYFGDEYLAVLAVDAGATERTLSCGESNEGGDKED